MKRAESSWTAEQSSQFSHHPTTVRGYVRYEVTRQNLQDVLADFLSTPRRVIDLGGGEGNDAIWLANLDPNHRVNLVEPDAGYIKIAKANGDSVLKDLVQGDAQTALDKYGAESFDLLLSHGVLQYLDNSRKELAKMAQLIKPGGYLSLLTAGRFGKINRYKDDQDRFSRLLLDGVFTNNLGAKARAYFPQELDAMLQAAGFVTIEWYGTRINTDDDKRDINEVSAFELNRLFSAELKDSRDPLKRPQGQMLHFIGRKV